MSKPVKLKENDRVRIFWFGAHHKGTVVKLREELGVDVQLDRDVYLPRCQWKDVNPKHRAPWYIMEKLTGKEAEKTEVKPVEKVVKPLVITKAEPEKPVKKITSIADLFDDNSKTELDATFKKQKSFTRGKMKK